jgi:hypothetical protein
LYASGTALGVDWARVSRSAVPEAFNDPIAAVPERRVYEFDEFARK